VKVDRYTKFVLTVIAVALSTLAFKDIVAPQPAVAGQPAVAAAPAIQCSFPSSITVRHSGGGIGVMYGLGDAPAPSPDSQ
jgi:hypothetical protein